MTDPGRTAPPTEDVPRRPTLAEAVLSVGVLIALIASTIVLFGIDATEGPLQVALFTSAAFAALLAFRLGYRSIAIRDAAIGGVSSAMQA